MRVVSSLMIRERVGEGWGILHEEGVIFGEEVLLGVDEAFLAVNGQKRFKDSNQIMVLVHKDLWDLVVDEAVVIDERGELVDWFSLLALGLAG